MGELMAFQKGPGEGYMAAKDDALAMNPSLKCKAVYYHRRGAAHGSREQVGFVVLENGKTIGRGKLARDAWGDALGSFRTQKRMKGTRLGRR